MELSHSIVPFLRQIEQDFEIKQKLNKHLRLNLRQSLQEIHFQEKNPLIKKSLK